MCSSAPREVLTLDVYLILDCQENKVLSTKLRISKNIRRIPTWEDCREKCNQYGKCHHFNFKVCSVVDRDQHKIKPSNCTVSPCGKEENLHIPRKSLQSGPEISKRC